MFFFDPIYIVLIVVTLAITGWAAWRVKATYAKWAKVDSGINVDAFDFARRLLDRQGLQEVRSSRRPGSSPITTTRAARSCASAPASRMPRR